MSQNVTEWTSNFTAKHVDDNVNDGEFISGESIVIAALNQVTGSIDQDQFAMNPANYTAIGLLETGSVRQDKQIQQLFEIGSALPYFVPGHTMISMALNRVMFNGESLLKVIYGDKGAGSIVPSPGPSFEIGTRDDPRQADFYINLASTFFNSPTTIGIFMCDNSGDFVGGFGLAGCYVQSHVMAFSSRQVVIAENVSIRATKMLGFATAESSE